MSKWAATKEHKEAAAGALLVLGGMLYEWGLPLDRAIEGLKRAYELEQDKQLASEIHDCPECGANRTQEPCKHQYGPTHCCFKGEPQTQDEVREDVLEERRFMGSAY